MTHKQRMNNAVTGVEIRTAKCLPEKDSSETITSKNYFITHSDVLFGI